MIKKKLNKKLLYIITLFLVILFSSVVGVYAERIIASNKVTYNNGTSGLTSTNVQGAVDELYLKCINDENGMTFNFARFLQSIEENDTVIADDGTVDHNMRYIGANPNNYVKFASELWRVIGVFNNVSNGSKSEARVKIIKAESIGNKQWHTSKVNIWKSSSLNVELQTLSYASNIMVENAVWYLGDPGGVYNYTAAQAYSYERGVKVASGNDATWIGRVGLMYPSDYGFASLACKDGTKNLNEYDVTDIDCEGTDWLFNRSNEWFLSPNSDSTTNARNMGSPGYVGNNGDWVSYGFTVRPVVYLKSNVICKNCNEVTSGTKENPFQLG